MSTHKTPQMYMLDIPVEYAATMDRILANIHRKNLFHYTPQHYSTISTYVIKIKTKELMLIKLSIPNVICLKI